MDHNDTRDRPLALITGITGGIGGAVAAALLRRGWRVRAVHRNPEAARAVLCARGGPLGAAQGVEWFKGDALDAPALCAAAQGTQLIFHGANTPHYKKWRQWALPMLQNALEAARSSHARLVFPGNIYNFGADAGTLLSETSPQNPQTRKGQVRVEMELCLKEAAQRDGVRSLIVRAGDFFGPTQPGSWLGSGIVKPGRPVGALSYPGDPEIGHSWAYLPDLAEAIARLAERSDALADFEVFHFGGHWLEHGGEICQAIYAAAKKPPAPLRPFPWWLVVAGAPFVGLFREVLEMRYLWQQPLRLDNRKLLGVLGDEPHTPLEIALAQTLAAMGCLPMPAPALSLELPG